MYIAAAKGSLNAAESSHVSSNGQRRPCCPLRRSSASVVLPLGNGRKAFKIFPDDIENKCSKWGTQATPPKGPTVTTPTMND